VVLLVDDESGVRDSVRLMFDELYDVVEAPNGSVDSHGLESLLAQLRFLKEGRTDHVHLMSEAWGGTHLSDRPQTPANTIIHRLRDCDHEPPSRVRGTANRTKGPAARCSAEPPPQDEASVLITTELAIADMAS